MAEVLKLERARALARSLTTIDGFPRYEEAIEATAEDLVRWCRGVDIDGKYWPPERQAYWLVTEARENMADRWESTAALLAMFNKKFAKPVRVGNAFVDYSKEPCICGSGKKFKDCCQGKTPQEIWSDWPLLPPLKRTPPQPPNANAEPITQEDIDRLVKEKKKPQ